MFVALLSIICFLIFDRSLWATRLVKTRNLEPQQIRQFRVWFSQSQTQNHQDSVCWGDRTPIAIFNGKYMAGLEKIVIEAKWLFRAAEPSQRTKYDVWTVEVGVHSKWNGSDKIVHGKTRSLTVEQPEGCIVLELELEIASDGANPPMLYIAPLYIETHADDSENVAELQFFDAGTSNDIGKTSMVSSLPGWYLIEDEPILIPFSIIEANICVLFIDRIFFRIKHTVLEPKIVDFVRTKPVAHRKIEEILDFCISEGRKEHSNSRSLNETIRLRKVHRALRTFREMLWNKVETSRDRQEWNWNVNHLIAFVIGRALLLRFLEATKHCKNENFPRQLDLVRYVAILRRFDSAIGLELAEQQQQQISNDDGRLLEVKQLEEGCLIKIDVVVFALNEESDKFFIIKRADQKNILKQQQVRFLLERFMEYENWVGKANTAKLSFMKSCYRFSSPSNSIGVNRHACNVFKAVAEEGLAKMVLEANLDSSGIGSSHQQCQWSRRLQLLGNSDEQRLREVIVRIIILQLLEVECLDSVISTSANSPSGQSSSRSRSFNDTHRPILGKATNSVKKFVQTRLTIAKSHLISSENVDNPQKLLESLNTLTTNSITIKDGKCWEDIDERESLISSLKLMNSGSNENCSGESSNREIKRQNSLNEKHPNSNKNKSKSSSNEHLNEQQNLFSPRSSSQQRASKKTKKPKHRQPRKNNNAAGKREMFDEQPHFKFRTKKRQLMLLDHFEDEPNVKSQPIEEEEDQEEEEEKRVVYECKMKLNDEDERINAKTRWMMELGERVFTTRSEHGETVNSRELLRYLFECDNSELEGRTEFSEFSLTEAFVCMERIYKLLNTYTSSDKLHIPMEWGNQDSLLSRTKQEMKDCINIANRDLIGSQVEVEWNEFRNEIMGKHFDRMFVQITNLIAWMLMDSSALNDYEILADDNPIINIRRNYAKIAVLNFLGRSLVRQLLNNCEAIKKYLPNVLILKLNKRIKGEDLRPNIAKLLTFLKEFHSNLFGALNALYLKTFQNEAFFNSSRPQNSSEANNLPTTSARIVDGTDVKWIPIDTFLIMDKILRSYLKIEPKEMRCENVNLWDLKFLPRISFSCDEVRELIDAFAFKSRKKAKAKYLNFVPHDSGFVRYERWRKGRFSLADKLASFLGLRWEFIAESLSHRMASDLERGYINEPKQALKPFVSANAEKNLKELLVNHLIIRWLYDRLDHEQQNSKDKGTEERILAGERGLHQIIEKLRANAVVINSERWYPEQWDLVKETHVFGPHPSDHFMKICLRATDGDNNDEIDDDGEQGRRHTFLRKGANLTHPADKNDSQNNEGRSKFSHHPKRVVTTIKRNWDLRTVNDCLTFAVLTLTICLLTLTLPLLLHSIRQ